MKYYNQELAKKILDSFSLADKQQIKANIHKKINELSNSIVSNVIANDIKYVARQLSQAYMTLLYFENDKKEQERCIAMIDKYKDMETNYMLLDELYYKDEKCDEKCNCQDENCKCKKQTNNCGVVSVKSNWYNDWRNMLDNPIKTNISNDVKFKYPQNTAFFVGGVTETANNNISIKKDNTNKNDNGDEYNYVNNPTHYNTYDVEVVDMMERIWGIEKTITWCELTAFKYRMRMGTKPNEPIERDVDKEKWYLNKAQSLREKLNK